MPYHTREYVTLDYVLQRVQHCTSKADVYRALSWIVDPSPVLPRTERGMKSNGPCPTFSFYHSLRDTAFFFDMPELLWAAEERFVLHKTVMEHRYATWAALSIWCPQPNRRSIRGLAHTRTLDRSTGICFDEHKLTFLGQDSARPWRRAWYDTLCLRQDPRVEPRSSECPEMIVTVNINIWNYFFSAH